MASTSEIESDKVDWMDWDELLRNVAQVKHAMYEQLRQVAEPMINEYLNNVHQLAKEAAIKEGPGLE